MIMDRSAWEPARAGNRTRISGRALRTETRGPPNLARVSRAGTVGSASSSRPAAVPRHRRRRARRRARGDRRAQRLPGPRRRHRHQPVPHHGGRPRRVREQTAGGRPTGRRARGVHPGRAAGCTRQLRGDPRELLRAVARWPVRGWERTSGEVDALQPAPRPATRRSGRRSRAPCSPLPGCRRGGRAPRGDSDARARRAHASRGGSRRARRTPEQLQVLRVRAWSTRADAASC